MSFSFVLVNFKIISENGKHFVLNDSLEFFLNHGVNNIITI